MFPNLFAAALLLLGASNAGAAFAQAATAPASSGQDIAQAASDPTAPLMSFQLQDNYTSSFHGLDDASQNQVQFRSALPFKVGSQQNIFRITLPIMTDTPSGEYGVADTSVFDLMTFNESWGTWGVGVTGLIPTGGADLGAEKWAVGPAIGFTAKNGNFLWGVFNQNLFTFAGEDLRRDVNISMIQPLVNLSLGDGWSIGSSEMSATYDWESNDWESLPLGAKLAKLVRINDVPVQLYASYEHNFADANISPEDTFGVGFKILLPTG